MDLYDTGRQAFYLDAKGPDAKEQSYHMQTELYKGIFEESEVYTEMQLVNEIFLMLPDSYHGYVMNEMEAFPVYYKETQFIKSGNGILHMHPVAGFCLDGEITVLKEEDRSAILNEGNRVTVLMRNDVVKGICMKEVELLTEKDLEYFRRKAEEGQAVILELSEEQLLHLDFG